MQKAGRPRVAAWSSRIARQMLEEYSLAPVLLIAAVAAVLIPASAHALPSTAAQATHAKSKAIEAHKRGGKARPAAKLASPVPVAEAPLEPPKPDWPVNNPPAPASVVLDSRGLRIDAMNSSLLQILRDVCAKTGARIEGLNEDERIFGVYGPGRPRDVIALLLEGTRYNVVMTGEEGNGAPLQIVLSERPRGGAQPNAPVNPAEIMEPAPYQPPVPAMRPAEAPHPPQTPQQILQEMQQRQEQMREEQMRQQNNQQR